MVELKKNKEVFSGFIKLFLNITMPFTINDVNVWAVVMLSNMNRRKWVGEVRWRQSK